MSNPKPLTHVKEHSRSIAHNTVGDVLGEYVVKGAPTMIAWVAAISAYMRDQPLWLVILIGSTVFLLLSFTWYFIGRRRALGNFAEGESAPRHEKEPTEALAPRAFTEDSLSDPEYIYSKDWLRNIAERDKRQIDWAAKAIECYLECGFRDASPFLRFRFTVFNGSVYTVSINKVEGFILYGKRRLEKEITLSTKWKVENLTPRYVARVEILQWLTPEEAALLNKDWDEQKFSTGFSFEHLRLIVSGGDDFKDVVPKPLKLSEYERMPLRCK